MIQVSPCKMPKCSHNFHGHGATSLILILNPTKARFDQCLFHSWYLIDDFLTPWGSYSYFPLYGFKDGASTRAVKLEITPDESTALKTIW